MTIRTFLQQFRAPKNRSDIALFGNFGLRVFDVSSGTPRCTLRIQKKNQITNQGRIALLNLMVPGTYYPDTPLPSADDAAVQLENRIWSLSVGTNATPPVITDDDATMTPVWTDAFVFSTGECSVVTTTPNSFYLDISKILPTGEANGSTLTEAGVFTRGNHDVPASVTAGRSLYARQVHSPIIKTSSMTIQYDWQLGITIQS